MNDNRMRVFFLIIALVALVVSVCAKQADAQTAGDIRLKEVPRVSYFDTATCADYLSVPKNDRIQHNRALFRKLLWNPGYIRVQLECAQNPAHLRRMEWSIERMCKGRDDYLVRNAWVSALNAHKQACNWR